MANSITIVIQIVSMVLCFMGFVQLIVGAKWWGKQLYFYHIFYFGLFWYSALTLAEMFLSGREGEAVAIWLNVCIIARSLIAYLMGYMIVRHLIFRIDPEKRKKALCRVAQIIFGVQVLLRSLSRSAIRF